jgi:hypothetical protein
MAFIEGIRMIDRPYSILKRITEQHCLLYVGAPTY